MVIRARRLMRLLGIALVIGIPLSQATLYAASFDPVDMTSYLWAGEAWRTTGNPYSAAAVIVDGNPIYRYAPWFAVPWIGLSALPIAVVEVLWAAAMVGCAVLAVIPLLRAWGAAAIPASGFFLGWLVAIGLNGNVQPALIALLAWGVDRRWGPAAIAIAASLKAVPVLYVLVYAGRGEWGKVGWTLGLTAILVAPMLLFEIPSVSLDAGTSFSLFSTSPIAWLVVAAVSVAAAFALARTPYAWLAAGVAVLMALPRAFVYDVTFLLPGIAERREVANDPARSLAAAGSTR